MKVIFGVMVVLIIGIVLIDAIPIIKTWIGRIHIGRYDGTEQWEDSLSSQSLKWLNNTPKIKVTDNTRLIVIDKLKGNYSKSAIQHWQQAALILGLSENTENEIVNNVEIERYLKNNFDGNGQWIEKPQFVDCGILSYAIMKTKYADKYKTSFDYTYDLIKGLIGEDGTVKYRDLMSKYRYVDTVGFIAPFLIKYGVEYGNKEAIELGVKQVVEYYDKGFDKTSNIPFHAYDINEGYKLGLCGWGRGLGWFAIGIIDAWSELPNNHEGKKEVEKIIINFSKAITKLQLENGGWGWTVTRKESRVDSSTTATLAWFLVKATEISELEKENKVAVEKAINYLKSVTRRSGAIDFSQGDTKDIGVYSTLFDILPFAQGFALRAITKFLK